MVLLIAGGMNLPAKPLPPPDGDPSESLPTGAPATPAPPKASAAPPDAATDAPNSDSPGTASGAANIDNLEMVDANLGEKLTVVRVGSGQTDDHLLTVFAVVKNRTARELTIEMQTIYKDNSDNPMSDGKAGWVPITLKPYEEFKYRSVAISADAVDFLVRVRRAQPQPTP